MSYKVKKIKVPECPFCSTPCSSSSSNFFRHFNSVHIAHPTSNPIIVPKWFLDYVNSTKYIQCGKCGDYRGEKHDCVAKGAIPSIQEDARPMLEVSLENVTFVIKAKPQNSNPPIYRKETESVQEKENSEESPNISSSAKSISELESLAPPLNDPVTKSKSGPYLTRFNIDLITKYITGTRTIQDIPEQVDLLVADVYESAFISIEDGGDPIVLDMIPSCILLEDKLSGSAKLSRRASKIRSRCLKFLAGEGDELLEENYDFSIAQRKKYPTREANIKQKHDKWVKSVQNNHVESVIREIKGDKKTLLEEKDRPALEKLFPKAALPKKPEDLSEIIVEKFPSATVLMALRKQKKRSAGLSHLSGALLCKLAEASPSLLTRLTNYVNRLAAGNSPKGSASLASLGITLEKPGGFRPIVIEENINAAASKSFMIKYKREFEAVVKKANPGQKALEARGAEVIVHVIRSFTDDNENTKGAAIGMEDLTGCFQNLTRASWMPKIHEDLPMLSPMIHDQYTKANTVIFNGISANCTQGFAQGDSKAPLGSCLATAENTMASNNFLKRDFEDWTSLSFLDDVTKASTEVNVCDSIQYSIEHGPKNGEFINKSKTLVIPVAVLHGKAPQPAPPNFPNGVTRVTNLTGIEIGSNKDSAGTRMLGSPLGTQEYCHKYVLNRLEKTKSMYKAIAEIEHPHVVKHLMDRISTTSGFTYIYRTVPPGLIIGVLHQIEVVQRGLFEKSVVGRALSELQWSIAQLPYGLGGWNFIPPEVLSICGFLASLYSCKDQILESRPKAKSWIETQLNRATVLFKKLSPSAKPIEISSKTKQRDLVRHVMQSRYDEMLATATPDIKVLLLGEARHHAHAWKTAPPLSNLFLEPNEFRFAVRRSLRVEIFSSAFLCPEHKTGEQFDINVFGDHCLSCMPGGGVVHRHDDAYREIVRITRQALLSCSTEVTETFADGSTYRADIVISQPIPGMSTRQTAFDFTITNSFAPTYLSKAAKTPGYAIEKGIKRKSREVNIEGLHERGYDFKALSFECTGGCSDDTERLVNYILSEKAMVHNKPFSELVSEFWTLISVLIQRSNAQMIRKRLPSVEKFM